MKSSWWLAVVIAFVVCGCSDGDKQDFITDTKYINESSHTIEISEYEMIMITRLSPVLPSLPSLPNTIVINSGDTFSYRMVKSEKVPPADNFFMSPNVVRAKITFDGEISIVHNLQDIDTSHNFCNFESYTLSRLSDYMSVLAYTFTDADYDYAVEHGEPVERVEP